MADRETLGKYLRKVTGELRSAQRRVLELEQQGGQPVAIVGMACRYPGGVQCPEELWELLAEGRDAMSGFPADRGWDLQRLFDSDPDSLGASYAREGGFVADAADFDAEFFGISPREALASDPQQRLLLEASWEALESAGIDPTSLHGEDAGVFVGLINPDYGDDASLPPELDGYFGTGTLGSLASGRVAYGLGLQGPAITLDTACSSSLVALHLAVQGLQRGDCSLVLAGGATVLGTPRLFTDFSKQRGLAPDGRCKPFADAADGTGFAEGVGMLVLERLSDAQANGHPIHAVIRGSAVNQDGASNGITAPNGPSQERVIRQALANAGLEPKDVDAVEAHGTGTTLGDPIEAGALLATYGQDRDEPLKLGSIKSNIGHAQAAAGVAGVIKMALAMREGVLPKTLHVDQPSSKVDWEMGEIELLTEPEPWGPSGRPRRAAVSSFGLSGTNAHVILEEAPQPDGEEEGEVGQGGEPDGDVSAPPLPGPIPLLLSAKSEEALRASAGRLAAHLRADPGLGRDDVAHSLLTTRASLERRAVVLGAEREALLDALDACAAGGQASNLVLGTADSGGRPVFLFGGQGSQHQGMALELLDSSSFFARRIEECERALAPYVDWSLEEVLRGGEDSWLDRLDIVQPALFAVMVSLARLWEELGVRPAAVVGHSQGEIAAAHVAGALSLEDAARVVALRARAMTEIAGKGTMLAVSLSPAEIAVRIEPYGERVALAAINGPASLVLSGEPEALAALRASLEDDGVRSQPVAVDYAAHSAQIEALRDELLEAFAPIAPRSADVPFHSTVLGEAIDTAELDAEYWYRNLRETVLFEPVLRSLLEQGQRAFLEISPHPVLAFGAQETVDDAAESRGAAVLGTLRRDEGGRFALSLAEAHARGVEVDWRCFFRDASVKAVPLPTYPFQRKRYWLDSTGSASDPASIGLSDADHPLLGASVSLASGDELLLTGRLSIQSHPWLADHAVAGEVLLPGTAFLELALRAGRQAGAETVEELTLEAPLVLPGEGAVALQVAVSAPDEQGRREISIHSRPQTEEGEEDGAWTCHARGVLSAEARAPEPIGEWPPPGAERLDVEGLYERLADRGLEYGPAFQGLSAAWKAGEEIYAEVSLDEEEAAAAASFAIHPALLDSALHGGVLDALLLSGDAGAAAPKLPFSWSGASIHAGGASELRVRISASGEEAISISLADGSGAPVASIASLALRALDPERLRAGGRDRDDLLGVEWSELAAGEAGAEEAPFTLAESPRELLAGLEDGDTVPKTVLWHCPSDGEGDNPARDAREAVEESLELVQRWLAEERLVASRLVLVTSGAIAVGEGESPVLASAPLWGMIRSAQAEHPGRFALIDSDGSEASRGTLGAALAIGEEPQLALREGRVLAPRLTPVRGQAGSLLPPVGPWCLGSEQRGALEGLALLANPGASRSLGPTEVRIAVRAAGLNFRDVLAALGFDVPGGAMIGGEGAGVVVEVGAAVEGLAAGDGVMGVIADAFGPLAVSERDLIAPIPSGWSFKQAASVPTVFLTAYHGLVEIADLRPGQRVLVHAGAGGVGMAAIGLARHLGAEVFATASPSKWGALADAGVAEDHIASSRDLDFREKFLAATGGEGVDVVLNSLAGEFVDASLELLPRGGFLLEMGKTDVRDPARVGADHPGVEYRAFDIVDLEPEWFRHTLPKIADLFERGALRHSPLASWDIRRAPEAFRHLREGRNVGKVVLEIPRPIDPGRTVLISGATGTLGALTARHLVAEHGARHLLLASRSGADAEGAEELLAELAGLGAEATIAACDVSDRQALEQLLASIPTERPLGAVFHAAGALADATIEAIEPGQLETVFAPKANAAWHLHELTAELDLSAFVMFSSAAGTLGSPGQANYAAANAFLDALAQHRYAQGLPATSIAWGLWEQESALTAELSEADRARMQRSGVVAIGAEQGLGLLDSALRSERPTALAAPLDRAALRQQAAAGTLPAILASLVRAPARRRSGAGHSLAARLASLSEAEREPFVAELVRAETAAVLGHSSAQDVDPDRAFKELGFDSLAAVELRNRLATASGLRLVATTVFDHPTPRRLAAHLLAATSAGGAIGKAAVRARASEEPIAIVGMAARYPGGVSNPEQLWALLAGAGDAISGFPTDRGWNLERLFDPDPDSPGSSYAREGGFLAGAADFDAEFFGIGPREARAADPQQRLLLEACWEALEDAGLDPVSLRGSQTGVFAGVISQGYGLFAEGAPGAMDGFLISGTTTSVASGRVSYALGLEGPAMTVDTACSSSLVAMHLASQALRGGECGLALAGGAAVLANPGVFTDFSRQRGLAPDGRCKAFAESADGVGFAEGVGMLVLERLSDAQANGHPIHAVIRGSAVNQDGASNGLTAPNGPSQERVIRQALANARLEPKDIDAVEAHGTGTTLGDPIEAGALLATYGQDRDTPLKLGSIKSNIGHTQAAAGVAGVIKMALAMREGVLPKTLHVDQPSSKVDWGSGEIELLTEAEEWKPNGQPRRAAVSSFGISGTNAHVILEEAPGPGGDLRPGASSEGSGTTVALSSPIPLVISAKSEEALRDSARRLASHLKDNPDLDPTDVAYSLATTRAALEHRAVVIGVEREQLLEGLAALADGAPTANAISARATGGRLAYLLSGQGSQRAGMGKELYEAHSAYRDAFDSTCEALDPHLEAPLKEIVFAAGERAQATLDHTANAQPALFATEVALYRLLESRGLTANLLAGHSVGEIAAAHLSGVLSLADAARLIAARARLMGALPEGGAMVAIEATEAEATEAIAGREAELSIAAINGPTSIVVSGEERAALEIQALFSERGRKTKRLAVSHAFHSPLMEPMLEDFAKVAESLDYSEPTIPIASNLSGEVLSPERATDPAYWVSQVRSPVRFAEMVATLDAQGACAYLELGPDPVLVAMAQECLGDPERPLSFAPTLRQGRPEAETVIAAIATAHAAGTTLDWRAFFEGTGAKRVSLPTYPFQRKRYWIDSSGSAADPSAIGQVSAEHPLLGTVVEHPDGEALTLTGRVSLQSHPWLADHAVAGNVLLPGAAFVELALRAGQEAGAETVEELTLQAPLILPESGAVALQVSVASPDEDGAREISIHSRPQGQEGAEWACHAQGILSPRSPAASEPAGQWPPQGAEPVEIEDLYERLADLGLEYGPAFQGLGAAWKDGDSIYTEVSLGEEQAREAGLYGIHPALLDSALHGAGLIAEDSGSGPMLPFAWSDVSLHASGSTELRVKISSSAEGAISISLADRGGAPVATVDSLLVRPLDPEQLRSAGRGRGRLLGIEWREVALAEPVLGEQSAGGTAIWRSDPGRSSADPVASAAAALEAIQAWLASEDRPPGARLAILTEGGVAIAPDEDPDPATAAIWGLVRSAQSEHPESFVLIDSDGSKASQDALPLALTIEQESQCALRDGRALVPRAARLDSPFPAEERPPAFDPEATVLITGATGTLGALTARHLVNGHGARHLLLASRGGEGAMGAKELGEELTELGAEVQIAACDVSDPKALEKLLASIPEAHPLGAVFHVAGTLEDGLIESLGREQLEHVFAPKANAAWHLHELTEELDLSTFVMFSSAAGTLGSPGQANYAAANAFLDALAQHRHAQGLPATSIAWGLWERESAMTAELGEADRARMRRSGLVALSEERGLDLLTEAFGAERSDVLALEVEPAALKAQAAAGILPAILGSIVQAPTRRRSGGGDSFAAKLASLSATEREAHVAGLVAAEVAAVLGHSSARDIDHDRAFKELGFDSLAAVELRNGLSLASGLRLSPTAVFDYPSPAKLAAHLLAEASAVAPEKKVAIRAQASEEPIAIVGMAARYPGGVSNPEQLWALLAGDRDAISGFPLDRGWDLERIYDPDPESLGASYVREGGFMADAADFDAEFFTISPREALAMDSQQRLLLEATWEALEDAGIDPGSLRGSQSGVFAGIMHHDYGAGAAPQAELEGYVGTGVSGSVASGRIAYQLGLEGPAITLDTACSSSLVAMHLASQALRGGECAMAVAGGATVISTPGLFTDFSRQRGLAPDGRCKSFADSADGVGWSEGVGMLVLERLSDAQANGHPIHAVIRGSAVNQDGASNGLTAPNGPSQERVIRQALANARLEPKDIDAVEAHGTGTTLGDPIEAGALLATYGQDRETPLKLGSIKSNIGHTQAAAGVAGVIKMALAMREGVLPKTLHVDQPSSKVDWEAGEIELLTEAEEWKPNGQPRRAAVSSFGISGTNAHVILEEAPRPEAAEPAGEGEDGGAPASNRSSGQAEAPTQPLPGPTPLALSAKSEEALRDSARRLSAHLKDNPQLDPTDVAYSLVSTRAALEQRAVVLGTGRKQLGDALDALGRGEQSPATVAARATQARLAYLYSGQGSQRLAMGKQLYKTHPTYRDAFDAACAELDPQLGISLKEIVFAEGEQAKAALDHTANAQPALFATQVALHRLLESQGMVPELLAGHSIGELSALHLAGVLSLPDAAKLIGARAKLMGALPEGGAMIAIEANEAEVSEAIAGKEAELSIAAINGPSSVVISGAEQAALQAQSLFSEQGRKTKRLSVSHAFHSPLMEPMLEDFAEVASTLDYQEPKIPILSALSGELLDPAQATDPAYWVSHAREPVRFADAIEGLAKQGACTFIELGPDPVLSAMAQQCLEGQDRPFSFAPTLRQGREEAETLTTAIATAHASGAKLDWGAFFKGSGAKRVALPTYPFQRKRYWLEGASQTGDLSAAGLSDAGHPLLGATVALASEQGESLVLTGRISVQSHPWLADHAVGANVLLPGTAFLELALRAGVEVGAETLEELTLQAPLVLPEQGYTALQVSLAAPDAEGAREVEIHSRAHDAGSEEWDLHAQGVLSSRAADPPEPLTEWPPQGAESIEIADLYGRLADLGLEYGPAFQGLEGAWKDGETIYAEVSLGEAQASEAGSYGIHPALLDSAFHAGIFAGGLEGAAGLPFSFAGVSLHAVSAAALRVQIEFGEEGEASLALFDQAGAAAASIASLALRPLAAEQMAKLRPRDGGLLGVAWSEVRLTEPDEAHGPGLETWRWASEPGADHARGAAAALEAIQAWLAREGSSHRSRLAILTEGAVGPDSAEGPDPVAAAIWGLARSAQSEHPESLILIDTDDSEASQRVLPVALASEEPQLALRQGVALAPRAAPLPIRSEESPPLDPQRTVLITGATGGLGALTARHLVGEHGARQMLLVSRSGAKAEGAPELAAELVELGAEVRVEACDVSDRDQLAALLGSIPEEHALGAVVHAAGTLADATIDSLDKEQLDRVFAPKANAAWHLHELTEELDLSAFVMFSSAAGTLGSPGQANYAAANAFLDALAQQRHAQGLPATSIAWGLWEQNGGMASSLGAADMARVRRSGIAALGEEQGLALLDEALVGERPDALALRLDRAALRSQADAGLLAPILSGLVRAPAKRRNAAAASIAQELASLSPQERETFVLAMLRAEVAAVLGHQSADAIDPARAFKDLGFDSLAAVELRNRLTAATGLRLAPTSVFDYPTPAKLAGYLLSELGEGNRAAVDAELGRLELSLAAIEGGDPDRPKLAARLRALAADLEGDGSAEASGVDRGRLESASDDELLGYIDEQVGGGARHGE